MDEIGKMVANSTGVTRNCFLCVALPLCENSMTWATKLHDPREEDGEGDRFFGMSVDGQQQPAQAVVVKLLNSRAWCFLVTGVLMATEINAGHGVGPEPLWMSWMLFAPCLYLKILVILMQVDFSWCCKPGRNDEANLEERLAPSSQKVVLFSRGT